MSTEAVSVSLVLGAVLGAGWVKTFSDGAKSLQAISGISEELNARLKGMGVSQFSLKGLDAAQDDLKKARRDLSNFQSTLKNTAPTQGQQRELARLTSAVDAATRAQERQNQRLDAWKKKMREANVDVEKSLKLLRAQERLSTLSGAWGRVSSQIAGIGNLFKNAVFAASGYMGAITAATASVSNWGDTMAKTAQRLGMFDAAGTENVETLQRMQWAALQANIGNEEFVKYLDDMNRRVGQAAAGMGEAGKALEQLGLSAKALSGMGADRQFETIVAAFGKIENATERVRLAGQIWGEEASRKMPNLVARGMTQIRADMDAATNYIVSGNRRIVETAGAWDGAMKRLRAVATSAWRDGVLNFMPLITGAMESLSAKISENRERIAEVFEAFKVIAGVAVPAITSITETLAGFAIAVGKNKTLVSALGVAFATVGGIVAVWKTSMLVCVGVLNAVKIATGLATAAQWALNAAMAANPVGLVIVGIAALAAAIAAAAYAVYSNWEPISAFFSELCGKIGAGFSAAWAGIRDGFAAALNFVRSGVDWLWNKIAPLLDALKKLKAWWSGEEAPAAQPAANAPAAAAAPGYAAAVPALSGADLESMSRAAISNSNSVRTDARTFNTNANFTIVQQPGEDAEALARRVSERLAESYDGALAAAL